MEISIEQVNWLSVAVATVSAFVVGAIWYGPLFGKAWMTAFGFSEQQLRERSMSKVFALSIFLTFIAALNLELFLGPQAEPVYGFMGGLMAGLGWIATMLGVLYLFEMRSIKAFAINGGYCVVALSVMGLILGLM